MSSALYATRLVWDGRQGLAKLHGFGVPLKAPPLIDGLEFESIDYIPEIRCWLIRQRAERERDMTLAETKLVDHYLVDTCKR